MVDIQGVAHPEALGGFLLTDPQLHSKDGRYGSGDLKQDGINKFFASHVCGDVCRRLGLKPVVCPVAPA